MECKSRLVVFFDIQRKWCRLCCYYVPSSAQMQLSEVMDLQHLWYMPPGYSSKSKKYWNPKSSIYPVAWIGWWLRQSSISSGSKFRVSISQHVETRYTSSWTTSAAKSLGWEIIRWAMGVSAFCVDNQCLRGDGQAATVVDPILF